ncbi:hypothetical protein JXM83_01710 [Candidatus Woesearchaeota archaeon]|nr:hypothetical protein [Candidatus Woesearchaeota archaeon]
MGEEKTEFCYQFWNCKKENQEKCTVFKTNSCNECWFLFDVNKEKCEGIQTEKFNNCTECDFFKQKNKKL